MRTAVLAQLERKFLSLLAAMEQNQDIRDEFTENFSFPERQWDRLASDERIHAWLAEAGAFSQESVPQSQMA
ncbi:monooxygenase [Salinisphaera sp. S4-8]